MIFHDYIHVYKSKNAQIDNVWHFVLLCLLKRCCSCASLILSLTTVKGLLLLPQRLLEEPVGTGSLSTSSSRLRTWITAEHLTLSSCRGQPAQETWLPDLLTVESWGSTGSHRETYLTCGFTLCGWHHASGTILSDILGCILELGTGLIVDWSQRIRAGTSASGGAELTAWKKPGRFISVSNWDIEHCWGMRIGSLSGDEIGRYCFSMPGRLWSRVEASSHSQSSLAVRVAPSELQGKKYSSFEISFGHFILVEGDVDRVKKARAFPFGAYLMGGSQQLSHLKSRLALFPFQQGLQDLWEGIVKPHQSLKLVPQQLVVFYFLEGFLCLVFASLTGGLGHCFSLQQTTVSSTNRPVTVCWGGLCCSLLLWSHGSTSGLEVSTFRAEFRLGVCFFFKCATFCFPRAQVEWASMQGGTISSNNNMFFGSFSPVLC